MGIFIAVGLLIVFSVLALVIWEVNRRNKVSAFDLGEVVVYLLERKKVFTQIQGHSAVFDPITFLEEKPGEEVTFVDIMNAPEGISLTLTRNDKVRKIQWPDDLLGKNIVQEIVKVLYPEHLLQPLPFGLKGNIHFTAKGDSIVYEQKGIETDQNYLKSLFDLLVYLIETYPSVLALGGEVIEPLIKAKHILPSIAPQLIQDIALDTHKRIGDDPSSYLCLPCLARCTLHTANLSLVQQINYYGCRICRQSRSVVRWKKPIVAVLDNTIEQPEPRNGVIRENWITSRRLFDFNEVQILQANDEEIERFAIQVGNDTDVERKSRQKQIRCVISSTCKISENTLRILKNMFGQIEIIVVA